MTAPKPVYIGDHCIGHAHSWNGAAPLVSDMTGRRWSGGELQHIGDEGPDGFFLPASILQRRVS